jgi:hypothetical protein
MKHSEILRAQRKSRQQKRKQAPLLSKKKRLAWSKPSTKEVQLRRTNPDKNSLERMHFGSFSPYKPLPETIELGINREISINHSQNTVIRFPWKSQKEEKEERRKLREKEHLALEKRRR